MASIGRRSPDSEVQVAGADTHRSGGRGHGGERPSERALDTDPHLVETHLCDPTPRANREEPTRTEMLALCGHLCEYLHMPTNLDIDPRLLEQAVKVSGKRTKTAAVTLALREYVARHEQKRVVELFGALEWDDEFDYKRERTRG